MSTVNSGPLAATAAIAFSPSRPTQKALTSSKADCERFVSVMGSATRSRMPSSGPSVMSTLPRLAKLRCASASRQREHEQRDVGDRLAQLLHEAAVVRAQVAALAADHRDVLPAARR